MRLDYWVWVQLNSLGQFTMALVFLFLFIAHLLCETNEYGVVVSSFSILEQDKKFKLLEL